MASGRTQFVPASRSTTSRRRISGTEICGRRSSGPIGISCRIRTGSSPTRSCGFRGAHQERQATPRWQPRRRQHRRRRSRQRSPVRNQLLLQLRLHPPQRRLRLRRLRVSQTLGRPQLRMMRELLPPPGRHSSIIRRRVRTCLRAAAPAAEPVGSSCIVVKASPRATTTARPTWIVTEGLGTLEK